MNTPMNIEWLRSELRRPGRSQSALARHLKLHPSAVNKLLAGKRDIKVRELAAIEEYLAATVRPDPVGIESEARRDVRLAGAIPVTISVSRSMVFHREIFQEVSDKLTAFAKEKRDRELVLYCTWILFRELKLSIAQQLRDISSDDIDLMINDAGPLVDSELILVLAKGLSILNAEERERLAALARAATLAEPADAVTPQIENDLNVFCAAPEGSTVADTRWLTVIETTKFLELIFSSMSRRLSDVRRNLEGVFKRATAPK